jgi:(1->4)-alpha-D-glucan 1-alpha-D-glucosylmutase
MNSPMPRQKNSSQPTAIYNRFVGRNIDFEELVYQAKKLVMTTALAAEWNILANRLSQIAEAQPKNRDYTLNALRDAFLYNALAQY